MIVGSEPSTYSSHASTQPVRYALLVGTLPCVVALALTAFTALEKASVDPTVSVGVEGASSVPVPYVPIAVFAVVHSVSQLLCSARASKAVGFCLVAVAALFLFFAGPIRVSELAYGIALVLLQISLIGIILLPVVVALAIPLAGTLFGLAIYLPLSRAQRLGTADDGHILARYNAVSLVAAGVAAAILYVAVFGLPTWSAMAARGGYSFPRQGAGEAWFASAPVIALSCLLLSLAGVWTFGRREKRMAAAWLALCAVPVTILVAVGGWALSVAEVPFARSGIRQAPLLAAYSRFIRDGRPRISEPISLGGVEVAIDRSLLKYQLANSARQVTTVVFQPQPDLIALGVRGPVVLNKGNASPAQQEAELRGATCAADAVRPVIVCQFSKTIESAIEIDAAHPTRSLERKECRLIFADIGGLTIHARMELACGSSATWHLRADAIEQFIIGMLRRK